MTDSVATEAAALDARELLGSAQPAGVLRDGRTLLSVQVDEGTALEVWAALMELHASSGLWPFLIDPARREGSPTVWRHVCATAPIEEPSTADAAALFARWKAEYLESDLDDPDVDDEEIAEIEASHRCEPLTGLAAAPAAGNPWAAKTTEIGLCPAGTAPATTA